MSYPLSIILPNLNTPLVFLKERLQNIFDQTLDNWECIIIDGFSDNGSWEYLINVTKNDSRFKCIQLKREGVYQAWNHGIEIAQGQYIYIATSDDTMANDCLQKMAAALDTYKQCEIACCLLKIINEKGEPIPGNNWDNYYSPKYFGQLLHTRHIRYAPYDGILHCSLKTIYTSITQLLVRKTLFNKVGLFLTDQGPTADHEWGMRASLVGNVVNVPEYLATWRIHSLQLSNDALQWDPKTYVRNRFYIDHAFNTVLQKGLLDRKYYIKELKDMYWHSQFIREWIQQVDKLQKIKMLLHFLMKKPSVAIYNLYTKISGKAPLDNIDFARKMIHKLKLPGHIKSID